jgi:ribosomal protein S16
MAATPDDHTRQCAAEALGVPLALHPEAEAEIRGRFGGEATPQRLKMGEFPAGCAIVPNPFNRIPGFSVGHHYFVPGFPQMAWPMIEWVLDEKYRALFDSQRWAEASLIVYGLPESSIAPLMEEVNAAYPGLKAFSLPSMGVDGARRHIELGVRGAPGEVSPALERLRAGVATLGGTADVPNRWFLPYNPRLFAVHGVSDMVVIRLARGGANKRPFFSLVVADSRRAAQRKLPERVGFYDPKAPEGREALRVNVERLKHWQGKGAQLSPTVKRLVKQFGKKAA